MDNNKKTRQGDNEYCLVPLFPSTTNERSEEQEKLLQPPNLQPETTTNTTHATLTTALIAIVKTRVAHPDWTPVQVYHHIDDFIGEQENA